ncbi:MAG: alkaline phosphatase family protein [Pirellulales bacterium]|nr:alkaline phosphatase family protein [Pirellulales bacterium]MBL7194024.1 alkaline phosphatase family protein [Pirellulales bacterium]
MRPLLVINVVGLTPSLLKHTPRLRAIGQAGSIATLGTVLPAVTCSAQATMLTGRMPCEHGIVGNGWYFRDLAEVWFWRQSNRLVGCEEEKLWNAGRRRFGDRFTVAKMFWWYNMYAEIDLAATPRPVYAADGRKLPSIYTDPPGLKADLQGRLGQFPLFDFWGPKAGIRSSAWIADATQRVMEREQPSVTLCYLPHLDYDLQRFGPHAPEAVRACGEIDAVAGGLAEWAIERGHTVAVLSEYGITPVSDGVHLNRALRKAGLVRVQEVDLGWELLDCGACEAFAVADHQLAHVYVKNPQRIGEVKAILESTPGVAEVLDRDAQAAYGIHHERAGELVTVAAPDRWFTYYYWLDDAKMPDFARSVDIHRKPGYDPVELFVDPTLAFPKLRIAGKLAKKMLGFRMLMDVIGIDARLVRGSHGRLPASTEDGPLLLTSDSRSRSDHVAMTDVRDLLLDLIADA